MQRQAHGDVHHQPRSLVGHNTISSGQTQASRCQQDRPGRYHIPSTPPVHPSPRRIGHDTRHEQRRRKPAMDQGAATAKPGRHGVAQRTEQLVRDAPNNELRNPEVQHHAGNRALAGRGRGPGSRRSRIGRRNSADPEGPSATTPLPGSAQAGPWPACRRAARGLLNRAAAASARCPASAPS